MKILHPNLIRKSVLFFVLLGVFSCGKDDAPPTPVDPCNTTPLLGISVAIQGTTITATAAGGEAPYTFQLDNGDFQNSGTFPDLEEKEYTVTVKDANDCIDFTKVTVEGTGTDTCEDSTLAVEAAAEANTITATASEGTEPYTYSLDGTNFQESNEFADQDAGDYTVTVKDAKGCTSTADVSVAAVVDPCLDSDLAVEPHPGTGDLDEFLFSISPEGSGGTPPYTYSIDGENFSENNFFGLNDVGEYTVTIMDANGCTSTTNFSITCGGAESVLSLDVTAEAFEIVATAKWGKEPYAYSIDGENFQESGTFSDLEQQNYTITVKDANGCTETDNVTADEVASFTDPRDDKTYPLTKIGDQIWFAKNLEYQGNDVTSYCYGNAKFQCDDYGALYKYADALNAAPDGWHLPTEAELDALAAELGGYNAAGAEMKEGGSSGFEALYGGAYIDGSYVGVNVNGYWWTSNAVGNSFIDGYRVNTNMDALDVEPYNKDTQRLSVRLIKD